MLSFSAEFPVKDGSLERFAETIKSWRAGSPHGLLDVNNFKQPDATGQWECREETERLECLVVREPDNSAIAYRHQSYLGGISWNTELVLSIQNGDNWVSVRISRESDYPQQIIPDAKNLL